MFALVQGNRWSIVSERVGTLMANDRTHTGERFNGYEYLIYVG